VGGGGGQKMAGNGSLKIRNVGTTNCMELKTTSLDKPLMVYSSYHISWQSIHSYPSEVMTETVVCTITDYGSTISWAERQIQTDRQKRTGL
jgi:hypothetical protein